MRRVLAIELRRSVAPGTAVLMLLAPTVLLWAGGSGYGGTWTRLAFVLRDSLLLLCPLALAAGAWQSRRRHLAAVAELEATLARPRPLAALPLLAATGIAAAVPYGVVAVVAALRIRDRTDYLPAATLVAVVVGALSIVASVWVGLAVGRLLPFRVTAPALAVVSLGLLLAALTGGPGAWVSAFLSPPIDTGWAPQARDFLTVSGRLNLAQAGWLSAVAVSAVLLLTAASRRGRLLALLPALLGLAAAAAVAPRSGDAPGAVVDRAATALECTADAPRVCVARVHAARLPGIAPAAREALRRLSRVPGGPTVAVEDVALTAREAPAQPPDTAYFVLSRGGTELVTALGTGPVSPGTTLLVGAGTGSRPFCGLPYDAKDAVRYWLLGTEPPPDGPGRTVHQLWQGLRALPEPEAARRVSALRRAALRCADHLDGVLAGSRP